MGSFRQAHPLKPMATLGRVRGRGPQPPVDRRRDAQWEGSRSDDSGIDTPSGKLVLHSFEECCKDKRAFAENFHWIETHANMMHPDTILEPVGKGYVQINPPFPPATTEEMDSFWDLPFTKLPHPRYKGKRIPAYDMIKFSVNTHRGCFGGCNFCTIAAHQGKFISSRSEQSIPTANMYGMHGKNLELCDKCKRRSCLFPKRCPNLDCDHTRLMELYKRIDNTKGIRHSYIGSGIRYDLFLTEDGFVDTSSKPYLQTLVLDHTSGRLKVAPEHTEDHVLQKMAKPSFRLFERLRKEFDKVNREAGTHVGLVPYFISSHPGCTMKDMEHLASHPALKGIWMDQVQDFTPTPMTTSSVMFYTGLDPRDMTPVFTERDPEKKQRIRRKNSGKNRFSSKILRKKHKSPCRVQNKVLILQHENLSTSKPIWQTARKDMW